VGADDDEIGVLGRGEQDGGRVAVPYVALDDRSIAPRCGPGDATMQVLGGGPLPGLTTGVPARAGGVRAIACTTDSTASIRRTWASAAARRRSSWVPPEFSPTMMRVACCGRVTVTHLLAQPG
jgi:hypothetical protein